VRSKLKRFPEIVDVKISREAGMAWLQAQPSFDQYVALQHALEDAGGAIQMFHPAYLIPQAHYGMLGVRERTPGKLIDLEERLKAVPGVRSAIIDQDRWFTNADGQDVGGVVVFADPNPRLEASLVRVAKQAGFVYEPREHGEHGGGGGGGAAGGFDHDEWSEFNHAFAGLCLLVLAGIGAAQLSMARPPCYIKYGTVLVSIGLVVFLFICADRNAWPLGRIGWFESFQDWDTVQHRLGTGLLALLTIGDYLRLRKGWKVNSAVSRWAMLTLGLVGSGMLFTHLHRTIDPTHYAIADRMNRQHLAMASSALLFALSKFAWDTWQVPKRGGRYLWLGFLALLGLILVMYVE
jgi:putative copper resistance protein D